MLHIHSVGETLVHDELHAAIELVRQHAQLATAPTQLGKQGGDARVGLRQVVGIGAVVLLPAGEAGVGHVLGRPFRNRLVHERLHAVAHIGVDLLAGARGQIEFSERIVSEHDEVVKRIEQRAVHIEHERVEGRRWFFSSHEALVLSSFYRATSL